MQSARPVSSAAEEEPPASSQSPASSAWDNASQRTSRTGQAFDRLWQRPRVLQSGRGESEPAALWDRVTAKARSEAGAEVETSASEEPQTVPEHSSTQAGPWTAQSAPESSRTAQAWDRIASRQARVPTRLPQLEAMDSFEQGLELVKQRKYEEALRIWERAVELDPENTRLVTNVKRLRDRLMRDG